MGRRAIGELPFNARMPTIGIYQTDLDRYVSAAARRGWSLSEFIRHALDEATKTTEQFFYVRFPNGATHPTLNEPGYEFFDNARRFAARSGGTVIRAAIDPTADPGRDASPAD